MWRDGIQLLFVAAAAGIVYSIDPSPFPLALQRPMDHVDVTQQSEHHPFLPYLLGNKSSAFGNYNMRIS
jgi:hypothetical protein